MRVLVESFWTPKHGNSAEEYEDAFAPGENGTSEGSRLRFAVADGATETSYSGSWARLLVRGYLKDWIGGAGTEHGLERLGRIWYRSISRKSLPWHAQNKIQSGAYAALVGLEVISSDSGGRGRWKAWAVGDCCLFHLSRGSLRRAFPIDDPEEFGNRPVLLSSYSAHNGEALAAATVSTGRWKTGDAFFLASDALAAWFLAQEEADNDPWSVAQQLGAGKLEFSDWIEELREAGALRNDDVTLTRIAVV